MSFGLRKLQPSNDGKSNMNLGLRRHQDVNISKGGMIQGKGTGTSDSIQATVPAGSYIMPADSTQHIGEQNLDQLADSVPINVSNGEYGLTPNQVYAVGVQALNQMKAATHTPVDQPQVQNTQGEKPPLFFANGGLVSASPSADEIHRARQPQLGLGGSQMRDVTPQARQLPAQTAPAPTTTPQAAQATTVNAPSTSAKAGSKVLGAAKGLGAMHGLGAMAGGAVQGINTSTDQYAQRLGLNPNADRGFVQDLGIRTAGVMSDVGNAASFGLLGNRFADKKVAQAKADSDAIMADIQKRRADRDAIQSHPSQTVAPAKMPDINQQMNDSLYGNSQQALTSNLSTDPYAIMQQGNSFSYANPLAAAQARTQGIPELQSGGGFGLRKANDHVGVANLMANTREMGPSEQQIAAALQQNGQGGFGLRYPDRPQQTDEQINERKQIMSDIRAPIKGARGLTANQRSQMIEMNQNEANRGNDLYKADANNATSIQNNAANNAASILQTGMREDGQNVRQAASLNQDSQKFNANFGLQAREQALTEKKEGFGIRQAEKVETLHEMYDKAKTDEQRQSILARINRLIGAKPVEENNPYIKVKRNEILDNKGNVIDPGGEVLFNYKTGQTIDPLSQAQSHTQSELQNFKNYQVYEDGSGNRAFLDPKTGKFLPIS